MPNRGKQQTEKIEGQKKRGRVQNNALFLSLYKQMHGLHEIDTNQWKPTKPRKPLWFAIKKGIRRETNRRKKKKKVPRENGTMPLDAGGDQRGSHADLRILAIEAVQPVTLINRSGCLQHASEKEASADGWRKAKVNNSFCQNSSPFPWNPRVNPIFC